MATRYNYTGGIVTNGLVLNLDAAKTDSYPGTGTTWRDLSGNSNNGTLTNGPTYTGVSKDAAIVFDGVDDFVDCSNPLILRPSQFTTIAWIYNTDSNSRQQGIYCSYSEVLVAGYFVQVLNSPHRVRYVIGANTGSGAGLYTDVTGNTTININTWYQIVTTYDGLNMKSYVNGILDINTTWSNGIGYDDTNNRVLVGSVYTKNSGPVAFFKGSISDVQTYNRALSAAEVLQNFNALKGRYSIT